MQKHAKLFNHSTLLDKKKLTNDIKTMKKRIKFVKNKK